MKRTHKLRSLVTVAITALTFAVGMFSTQDAVAIPSPISGGAVFGGFGKSNSFNGTITLNFGQMNLIGAFGDFANASNPVQFNSFSYTGTGTSAVLTASPVSPLWKMSDFSFSLFSLTNAVAASSYLNVQGTGIVYGNGFAPTEGSFWLGGVGSDGNYKFEFSTTLAKGVSVPDGGATVFLLGGGLLGLALFQKRRFTGIG